MRKKDLIHLHGVLREVVSYCEREHDMAVDLCAYESLGTTATAIHLSKDEHRIAVFTLIDAIITALPDEEHSVTSPPID